MKRATHAQRRATEVLPIATSWTGAVSGGVTRSFDADSHVASETAGGTAPVAFDYDDDGLLTGAGALTSRDADTGLVLGTARGATTTTETPNASGESTSEELWCTYIQLTEAEAAFRIHKSDLSIRPICHQKAERVQTNILVCFRAYVLWKTLE